MQLKHIEIYSVGQVYFDPQFLAALHLEVPEGQVDILQLNLSGDQQVKVRAAGLHVSLGGIQRNW